MTNVDVKVKLLPGRPEKLPLPDYQSTGAAAMDFVASEDVVVPGFGGIAKVRSHLAFEIPEGYEIQIRPRSGLGSKGVIANLGTIDSDYRGEVMAVLVNHSERPFPVRTGERVAQLKLALAPRARLVVVTELSVTGRGDAGFGSSGN